MKKSVLITAVCMFLAAGSSSVYAQRNAKAQNNNRPNCQLSQEQKDQMKSVQLKYAEKTLDLKNELNELKAKQRTLVSNINPDQKAVFANIDKMSSIKEQLQLMKLDKRLEMHAFLSEEQLAKAEMRRPGGKGNGKMGRRAQGMHRGAGMGQAKARFAGNSGMKQGSGKGMCDRNILNLSDDQKSKMKELRVAHMTDTKALRDEAEEIRLQQKHMITSANPDVSALKANVSRLSDIENTLAKKRFEHQLQVREILDKDQLVLFLSRPGQGKGFHRGRGAF